jgi:hypothetical protein
VGALSDGTWIGFRTVPAGYELVVGRGAESRADPAGDDQLLAIAIGYFEEALDEPPPELAATQEDLAGLVRWLLEREAEPARRENLRQAVDAIDDGLAGDAVVTRLAAARWRGPEQADVLGLLRRRVGALRTRALPPG